VGLLLARSANSLLQQSFAQLLGSMNFSFTTDLRPDATVLAVTIGFCVLATLIFSLVILATLVQHWRLRLVPGHPVEAQPLITLRPRYGMRMVSR
jgi:hypothetical protein